MKNMKRRDRLHDLRDPISDPPKLLDRVRNATRARHYSRRTEDAYVHWIRRYILVHGKRHPGYLAESAIGRFLTALAVDQRVAGCCSTACVHISRWFARRMRPICRWGWERSSCRVRWTGSFR
jgi:hypothetical protein